MKKSTLALVVMGIVASASVQAAEIYNKDGNKLDVYGKVKAMHYMSDNDSKDGDQSYIRFGFKGETQINDQLTGYGRWEAEFAGNKAESDTAQQKTRLAFAGLKYKDLGSFDYGRNLGALYDVEAWTDMFPEFGGDSSAQTDNFMTKRASGLATYRSVRRWVMSYRKGKILKASVMKIWSIISTSVLHIISTKICQRLLIIKSTNWIAIIS